VTKKLSLRAKRSNLDRHAGVRLLAMTPVERFFNIMRIRLIFNRKQAVESCTKTAAGIKLKVKES